MVKANQEKSKKERIYSALLTVPKDDVNFRSALADADSRVLRRVLWDLPEEGNKSKRKVLESRLRKIDPDAAEEFIRLSASEKEPDEVQTQPAAVIDSVVEIELDRIAPSRFEPQARRRARFTEDDLKSLADSIRSRGLRQPILVRPVEGLSREFEIVFGERRFLAAAVAGLDKIRCFVETLSDAETVELQYEENHQRKESNPLDDAFLFRFLVDQENYSPEQIADRFNKKLSEVEDLLALNDLCALAAQDFDDGVLPLRHAVYLAKFFSADVQTQICHEALAYNYENRQFGAVSFKQFKEIVEENFVRRLAAAPFEVDDERLHLKGTTVSAKCSECRQRTGFNTLFREISDQDSCLNRACFQFKTNVHLKLQREAIAEQKNFASPKPIDEAVKEVPLVTERKYAPERTPFREKVQTQVEILDEPECAWSTLALAVDGAKKGQKVWICEKKEKGENCAVHNPAPVPVKPDRFEIEKRQREFNQQVRDAVREKVFSEAMKSFDDYTPVWMFQDLVEKIVYKLWINSGVDMRRFIAKLGDWKLPGDFMDLAALRAAIAALSKTDQSRLLFLLVSCEHGFLPGRDELENLKKISKEYARIDYDILDAQVRLELAPDEFKPLAEKHLDALADGVESAVPEFWTVEADEFADVELVVDEEVRS